VNFCAVVSLLFDITEKSRVGSSNDGALKMLSRQTAIETLLTHQQQIQAFSVKTLFLFGSVARDEAGADSDVDLLVEFEKPVGLFTFIELKDYLEEILNCSVDLGTPQSLRPYLKDIVLREAVRAF
jgi:predicted nucleotidyltransferase